MKMFHLHFMWFVTFLCMTIVAMVSTLLLSHFSMSIHLSMNLFSVWSLPMHVSFLFDWMSVSFMSVVLMISSIIMIYSYNYMAPYSKSTYFLWLTVLFVLSMLLVISMSNLFFAMLGWDGLGLISFFLIVYYQNQSSIVSGIFTLLMNRLGDSFFLFSLVMMFYYYPDFTSFSSNISIFSLSLILLLTFMTKSALYPFSPWLPMAMAAPTPISALVHSSTLVTAGLYLMMRFSYLFYSSPEVMKLLICISIFTSFYAGMNTIFEMDLKKLIALSTLSHLGFIAMAFSSGLLHLAFFHLLVHALFKSLLFMTMGDIMINMNHSQDIRYLSKGSVYTPFSSIIMNISIMNLVGVPNVSGYFSKDLILEAMNFNNSSLFIIFVMYLNVIFTYYYSYKLFFFSFQSVKLNSYQLFHSPYLTHSLLMVILSVFTLLFSTFFMNHLFSFMLFYFMVPTVKFLPLFLNMSLFIYLVSMLVLPTVKLKKPFAFFSSMMFLSNIMMTFSSHLYLSYLFNSVKSLEMGFLNYSMNSMPSEYMKAVNSFIYSSLFKVQNISFIFTLSFFFIFLFSLVS